LLEPGAANRLLHGSKSEKRTGGFFGNYNYDDIEHEPILVNFGHMGTSETRTRSIYLVNHNPVPITVSTESVRSVTGLSMKLGRVGAHVGDLLPLDDATRTIMEEQRKGGSLDESILNSAYVYTSDIRFYSSSDDNNNNISTMFDSSQSLMEGLGELYDKFSSVKLYSVDNCERGFERGIYDDIWSVGDNGEGIGFLTSIDGGINYNLQKEKYDDDEFLATSDTNDNSTSSLLLPPGAIARYDINILSPPSSFLSSSLSSSMTSLLASGLKIVTSTNEIIPIIIEYGIIVGELVFDLPQSVRGEGDLLLGQDGLDTAGGGKERKWGSNYTLRNSESIPGSMEVKVRGYDEGL